MGGEIDLDRSPMVDRGRVNLDYLGVRTGARPPPGAVLRGLGLRRAALELDGVVDVKDGAGRRVEHHEGAGPGGRGSGRRLRKIGQVHDQPHWKRVTVPEERRSATMWASVTD